MLSSLYLQSSTFRVSKYSLLTWAVLATALKVVIIYFLYQGFVVINNGIPELASDYHWSEIVSNLEHGSMAITAQPGLDGILDLEFEAYRPPIYPLLLFFTGKIFSNSTFAFVLLHGVITTMVAWLSFLLVNTIARNQLFSIISGLAVFFFPMNFMKTGRIDEAPLLMVFLLAFMLFLVSYLKTQSNKALVIAGIFAGLALLTRFTALFSVVFAVIFILFYADKPLKALVIFGCVFCVVLSPWLIRNYTIYDELKLSVGSGRILLFVQSDVFIDGFPEVSPDDIERRFFYDYIKEHPYLTELEPVELDTVLKKQALEEAYNHPLKFIHSVLIKIKAFNPLGYYPHNEQSGIKAAVFSLTYFLTLMAFVISLFFGEKVRETNLILVFLFAFLVPAFLFFVISRHLYQPIILMIVYSVMQLYFILGENEQAAMSSEQGE